MKWSALVFIEKPCEKLTGHPSQVQLSPHPQAPVEAHPQPDIVFMGLKVCGLKLENSFVWNGG
jgi:hypothetical protein